MPEEETVILLRERKRTHKRADVSSERSAMEARIC